MAKTGSRSLRPLQREIADRWTPELVKSGFTPVANGFLTSYHKLTPRLRPTEALLVIHLMAFRWDSSHPRPSFNTLAKRMGVTATAVRVHARNMERKGYLKRIARTGTTNRFDLTPLFHCLDKLSSSVKGDPSTVTTHAIDRNAEKGGQVLNIPRQADGQDKNENRS